MKKKWLVAIGILGVAVATTLYLVEKNDRFLTVEIQSSHPYEPAFDTRPLSSAEWGEVKTALSQKYTYFGCGGQAFVFFSEDGNYAIKFFKQRHFRQPTYLNYIPFIDHYRKIKFAKRKKRITQEYTSYKIGFEELPKETELVYLHLNNTDYFKQTVTLIDRLKMEHHIDLDSTNFILQRKAQLVPDTINTDMQTGNVNGAKQTISAIVGLIVHRCKLGYGDKDPNIATNCGIYHGKAIKIDVGRFYHDARMKNPLFYKPELYRLTRPFRKWLSDHHPELVSHLDKEVQHVIFHG